MSSQKHFPIPRDHYISISYYDFSTISKGYAHKGQPQNDFAGISPFDEPFAGPVAWKADCLSGRPFGFGGKGDFGATPLILESACRLSWDMLYRSSTLTGDPEWTATGLTGSCDACTVSGDEACIETGGP
jgi:hypothetical protein